MKAWTEKWVVVKDQLGQCNISKRPGHVTKTMFSTTGYFTGIPPYTSSPSSSPSFNESSCHRALTFYFHTQWVKAEFIVDFSTGLYPKISPCQNRQLTQLDRRFNSSIIMPVQPGKIKLVFLKSKCYSLFSFAFSLAQCETHTHTHTHTKFDMGVQTARIFQFELDVSTHNLYFLYSTFIYIYIYIYIRGLYKKI